MHIEVLNPRTEDEWDRYILSNKDADFLQSFCWAQLVKLSYGFRPIFLRVEDGGRPVAYCLLNEGFAYYRTDRALGRALDPVRRFFTRQVEATGAPVILDDSKTPEIMASILEWLQEYSRKNRVRAIHLTPFKYQAAYASDAAIEKIFASSGYATRKWGTYLVDVAQDEASLRDYIKHSARKALNQIAKTGLVVKKTQDYQEYVDKFILPYNRMEKEFGRAEFPLYYVRKLKSFDLWSKYYHYFYAEVDGRIVGVLGMYVYNGYAAEIVSATSRYAYENKIYAQDLIHWEMFKFARSLGCHTFDMAGFNPAPQTDKERGISQFKEKWGGRRVEYAIYDLDFRRSTVFNGAWAAFQVFDSVVSR